MQIPTCSLLVQMCWMQNRYLKLTAKGRVWVGSTRVHHNTRTRQQPEAAGCSQEEHRLSPSSFLPPSRNKLPDSLSFYAEFALPQVFYFDLFQGDRDTHEVCLVFDGILIQQLVTAGAALMLTLMAGKEAQRAALGCSRLILFITE